MHFYSNLVNYFHLRYQGLILVIFRHLGPFCKPGVQKPDRWIPEHTISALPVQTNPECLARVQKPGVPCSCNQSIRSAIKPVLWNPRTHDLCIARAINPECNQARSALPMQSRPYGIPECRSPRWEPVRWSPEHTAGTHHPCGIPEHTIRALITHAQKPTSHTGQWHTPCKGPVCGRMPKHGPCSCLTTRANRASSIQ